MKLVLAYPLEVKYGSWVKVNLDLTAMEDVVVEELRVKFVLIHERGSTTLLDELLLESTPLARGEQYQADVVFRVSVPRPPVEPVLQLYIKLSYMVNSSSRYFEYKAPIALVPYCTYEELSRQLEEALERASLADELADEVEELKVELANLTGRCETLEEVLSKVNAEKMRLAERVEELQAEKGALENRVEELEMEINKLRLENERLREERSGLNLKLSDMQGRYSSLSSELESLKWEYRQLVDEYARALEEIGFLKTVATALAACIVVGAAYAALRLKIHHRVKASIMRGRRGGESGTPSNGDPLEEIVD